MSQVHLPRYEDDLAVYIADLRSIIYPSQSAIAKHLKISHSTVSRYEDGKIKPPISYVAFLIYQVNQRIVALGNDPDESHHQAVLLRDLSDIIRWNYADQAPFQNWRSFETAVARMVELPTTANTSNTARRKLIDWGDAPDVSTFVGRKTELANLRKWILKDKSRLVAILGMGGIGKTALAAQLTSQLLDEFEVMVWRSLRNAPYSSELVTELLNILVPHAEVDEIESERKALGRLSEYLREQHCLLILDNLEAIIRPNETTGQYREGYEPYDYLFRALGGERHRSCVILTSREKPFGFNELAESKEQLQPLQLEGVSVEQTQQLLSSMNLEGSEQAWQTLVEQYSGNPLALKLSGDIIRQLFKRDIGRYLESSSPIVGDIRYVLGHQLERLPRLSLEVLYWLAVEREPRTIEELRTRLVPQPVMGDLIDSLRTLQHRSLVDNNNSRFSLQNVVSEFTTDYLIRRVVEELGSNIINLFQKVALLNATAPETIRHSQLRLIVDPVAQRLVSLLGSEAVEAQLEKLRLQLKSAPNSGVGYAGGNLINLKRHLNLGLNGDDYSQLSVWYAYLRDTPLVNVNFSKANFKNTVFDSAFVGIGDVALSPDSTKLAVAVAQEVWVWNTDSLQLLQILRHHRALVWNVVFCQDSHTLFSRSEDGYLFRWDLHYPTRPTLKLHKKTHRVWSMAANADCSCIATGGEGGEILLWDGRSGELLNRLDGHTDVVRALAFSPDDKELASGGYDRTIRTWNLSSGRPRTVHTGHSDSITSLDYMPNGEYIVSGSRDNTIRVWHHQDKQRPIELIGHTDSVSAIKCSGNGQTIVSGSYDRTVRVWQLEDQAVRHVLHGHTQSIGSIDLDRHGTVIASGSYDRTVCLWDMETGQLLHRVHGKTFQTICLAFSTDESMIASGSADYVVRVWDMKSGHVYSNHIGHRRWVSAVAFNPGNPEVLASASYDRTVKLWRLGQSSPKATLIGHDNWVLTLAFHSNGVWLASGSTDKTVRIWDTETETEIALYRGHTGSVTQVCFHPHGEILASGDEDRSIRLWHIESGEEIQHFVGHRASIVSLVFSADGQYLFSMDEATQIFRWKIETGAGIGMQQGDISWKNPAVISSNKIAAVTKADGSALCLIHLDEEHELRYLPLLNETTCLAFSVTDSYLAGGGISGDIQIWDVRAGRHINSLNAARPYQGMNISGATGLTQSEREMLKTLGAYETHN